MNRRLPWIAGIGVPALVIAGAVGIPAMANAAVNLPAKSASQIVALAEKSAGTSFSGTVTQTSDLGLPDLSALGGGGSSASGSSASDLLSQLTGTHTARVFVAGDSKARVQTLDTLAERDVIRDGSDVWAYDSAKKQAVHVTLPSKADAALPSTVPSAPATPSDIATEALDSIGQYTTVSTSDNVRIAGQKAYQITLTPKNDATTLVGSVELAVDASTGVPLRAAITAAGKTTPAFSVAFTSIDYSTPADSVFSFTPPKGTDVKTVDESKAATGVTGSHRMHPGAVGGGTDGAAGTTNGGALSRGTGVAASEARPTVSGSGWSTVFGFTLSAGQVAGLSSGDSALLDQVTTKVSGGRIIQTALVSALVTDDGHVYVGAVTPAALEAAAGQ